MPVVENGGVDLLMAQLDCWMDVVMLWIDVISISSLFWLFYDDLLGANGKK